MEKTWQKASVVVEMHTDTDVKRKQTLNAVTQAVTNEQLTTLGHVMEALTGNHFITANVTNYYQYHA